MTQSVASLARAVGPFLAAVLINSSVAHQGADGDPHYMSDRSLFVTFWTGAAIMFVAFSLAFYFSRSMAPAMSSVTSQTGNRPLGINQILQVRIRHQHELRSRCVRSHLIRVEVDAQAFLGIVQLS